MIKLKFKGMLPYLIAIGITFYLLPLLGKDTGSFILILLGAMPLVCFTAALLYGIKNGFKLLFPVIVAILFVPTIFIYYNSSAWVYTLIYAGISLIGVIFGSRTPNKKNNHNN